MANNNMILWNSIFKTDPIQTKAFSRSGGYRGTAIKPLWLIKRATETFGPVGIGWGWEELENKLVAGVWCSKVRLWYHLPGKEIGGRIEQWGQTVMEGTNKNGPFVDEEAPKKAVTDAVTKCLSYLGFGGDVHMGLFDDSKYVSEVNQEFRDSEEAERLCEEMEQLIDGINSEVTFNAARAKLLPLFKELKRLAPDLAAGYEDSLVGLKAKYTTDSKGE